MTDRYDVLLADPPWAFDSTAGTGSRRSVERQYAVMTPREVKALDPFVNAHAAPICRCALWVPDAQLETGLEVLRAWGLEPVKTLFVWVKLGKREITGAALERAFAAGEQLVWTPDYGYRRLAFGAGRTTRNGTEVCLLGARGSMPVASRSERQVIIAPVREHSRKPDEQYARIERLYPGKRYLELFARTKRPGWAAWGAEVGKFNQERA